MITAATLLPLTAIAGESASTASPRRGDPDASLTPPPSAAKDAPFTVPERDRASLFGRGAPTDADIAFASVGTASGLQLLSARASEGYAWDALATLAVPGVEADQWVGNTCLTTDGAYAVAVFAPRAFSNDQRLFNEGAWAAVVNTKTSDVQSLGRGYSLSYSNPGCGSGTNAVLARHTGTGTELGSFDAADAAAGPVWTTEVDHQVTSAVAAPDGTILAAGPGGIERISSDGDSSKTVQTDGAAYDLTLAGDRLTFAEHNGVDATIRTGILEHNGTLEDAERVGSGELTKVGLARDATGGTYIAGIDSTASLPPSMHRIEGVDAAFEVSTGGRLAVNTVTAPPPTPGDGATTASETPLLVDATAVNTGDVVQLRVAPNDGGSRLATTPVGRPGASGTRGSSSNPSEAERVCAIPRNDPRRQALQPKPRQVEWAVNRIVSGQLSISRPANWNGTGMAAYSPGAMFPKKPLEGGGRIPSQVLLGVLAQESNLWQASRYTSPGEAGNPLIGNFYGTDVSGGVDGTAFWWVDFSKADCGYGVGQITDGMRLAGREHGHSPALPAAQQQAIALDYTANIARAAQMLTDKWNETRRGGTTVNDGDSSKIENWFAAVWAYNTGYHTAEDGAEGLGWFNNPVNPIYNPSRHSFLDGNAADAAHPQDWPYGEKVMGFAANSLGLIEKQTVEGGAVEVVGFRTAWWNGNGTSGPANRTAVKPPLSTFCSVSVNDCSAVHPAVCSRDDFKCWWTGNATWKNDCSYTCGNEFERFAPAADYMAEQANGESFPPSCTRAGLPSGSLIVDDVPLQTDAGPIHASPANPACTTVATTGSFRFDFGAPGGSGSHQSKIDTHQLGAGLNGHFYFSHTWNARQDSRQGAITGTWSLGRSLSQWSRVFVHLPDHAAWAPDAKYTVDLGNGRVVTRSLPQRRYANEWVSLGVFDFTGAPTVSLTNITGDADDIDARDDIAWDAVAFQPLPNKPKDIVVSLGDSFSSGEGAGKYEPVTDNNGDDNRMRNACHRSSNAWSRLAKLPGSSTTIGARDDSNDPSLDYHGISCSGAETRHLFGETAEDKQYEAPQLQQGYLDVHTTLVTFSIGGNDVGFSPVLERCVITYLVTSGAGDCRGAKPSVYEKLERLEGQLDKTLNTIRAKAPNAKILVMGYPALFGDGVKCMPITANDVEWLQQMNNDLNTTIKTRVTAVGDAKIVFANPTSAFDGRSICGQDPAINNLLPYVDYVYGSRTNGDKPMFTIPAPWGGIKGGIAQASIHPNAKGTALYAHVMEQALGATR
ncbi:GDSL-type esterase/lipase family protein [Curtobacterium sp. MCBA15_008]|uniref:GDSL-type esterase/lipase family protein n=1 Tax=Curtobacterium sp. MCBA15_008 TaxID=1898736 RepID=UPI000923D165|nr:GDSL-type esterase/lipase family protein [Curtobacterium sp. MCBA15_008]OII14440.1 hypothetical protein BIU96_10950 [Curtobacterium sp. MCBA15_008]